MTNVPLPLDPFTADEDKKIFAGMLGEAVIQYAVDQSLIELLGVYLAEINYPHDAETIGQLQVVGFAGWAAERLLVLLRQAGTLA